MRIQKCRQCDFQCYDHAYMYKHVEDNHTPMKPNQSTDTTSQPETRDGEDALKQTLEEIVHDYDLVNSGIVTAPSYTHETFLQRIKAWALAESMAASKEDHRWFKSIINQAVMGSNKGRTAEQIMDRVDKHSDTAAAANLTERFGVKP